MQIKASKNEMKARSLELMRNICLADEFIEKLDNKDYVSMSEQYAKSKNSINVTFGCHQKRTYFDTNGNMYDVYPYVAGLPEIHEVLGNFEEKYGYFVYHMHYMQTNFGVLLTLLYLPDRDYRYGKDETIEDDEGNLVAPTFLDCWDEIEQDALEKGFLPCYVFNFDYEEYSEFSDVFFCTTDNGCFMRLA